ncbi:hypothetical protein QUF63_13385 [Anaerolineales bacterium HSG25]|nr:hypothetical protein [Anaerolineales bacterium HSG25]
MNNWLWKLREAVERLKSRYDYIGRKTGAPFLAVVYPLEAEVAVLKEWHTLIDTLPADYTIKQFDLLATITSMMEEFGVEDIVEMLADPMPGSDPNVELGTMWVTGLVQAIGEQLISTPNSKLVISLERLAALHPVTTPHALMQALWDNEQSMALDHPVIILIPGRIDEARVYSFLNQHQEVMYRGDIL